MELKAIFAELHLSVGSQENSEPQIYFQVQPVEGEQILLASGERIEDMLMSVTVGPDVGKLKAGHEWVGTLRYVKYWENTPSQIAANVLLHRRQFVELISATKLGRLPEVILLGVDIESAWDCLANPELIISSAVFFVPLGAKQ